MPSVLGVLERRERVAPARAEEFRAELEWVQAAVVEADEAARRAVIAREEIVAALAEAAEEAGAASAAVDAPAMGGRRASGQSPAVVRGGGGWGSKCFRPTARGLWPWSRRTPPVVGRECGRGVGCAAGVQGGGEVGLVPGRGRWP